MRSRPRPRAHRWQAFGRERAARGLRRATERRRARMTLLARSPGLATTVLVRDGGRHVPRPVLALHVPVTVYATRVAPVRTSSVPVTSGTLDRRPALLAPASAGPSRVRRPGPMWTTPPGVVVMGATPERSPDTGTADRRPGPLLVRDRDGAGRAVLRTRGPVGDAVRRLVEGHRRTERAVRPAAPGVLGAGTATGSARAAAAGPGGPDARAAGRATGASPEAVLPTPQAAVDVERLTDRIVSRLDERLTAHRERFGRAF